MTDGKRQRTALVTGGATGIGRMAATGLAGAGARVLIASRKTGACAAVAEEINAMGLAGTVEGFEGDVGTEEGVAALTAAVGERTDSLDVLMNNAGATWGAPYGEFPHGAWEKIMSVNVAGLFQLTQSLTPMLENGASSEDPARVINVGSVMGTAAIGIGAYSYSASKAAVHHLTRILATELAAKRITVNAIAPGLIKTDFAKALWEDGKGDQVARAYPLKRLGEPEDVANAALYLAADSAGWVTGQTLVLDGGGLIGFQRVG